MSTRSSELHLLETRRWSLSVQIYKRERSQKLTLKWSMHANRFSHHGEEFVNELRVACKRAVIEKIELGFLQRWRQSELHVGAGRLGAGVISHLAGAQIMT